MRRATLACASLLLLAGLTACGNDDSGDDSKSEEGSSASATPTDSTNPSEDESSSTDTESTPSPSESESESESPEPDDENADYCDAVADAGAASDADSIEDLRAAVDRLVENLPDSASDEAEAGVVYLQSNLAEAKSLDDFTKSVRDATKKELANTKAYGDFESATCPSDEAPTPTPSE